MQLYKKERLAQVFSNGRLLLETASSSRFDVFIANIWRILHKVIVFLLTTLNK